MSPAVTFTRNRARTAAQRGEPLTGLGRLATACRTRLGRSCFPVAVGLASVTAGWAQADGPFRVLPYLQNPAPDAITVMWFSEAATAGQIAYRLSGEWTTHEVPAVSAAALNYYATETNFFSGGIPPALPYSHRSRLTGLTAGTSYVYVVTQDGVSITNTFRTAPPRDRAVRFVVYSDSETEPESTGKSADWPVPGGSSSRKYVVDQTRGYRENLLIMEARSPDFAVIAGDLVESGGEQRDWDEFWRHNAGTLNRLAGAVPILPTPGNHEYYGGTRGGYNQPTSEVSVAKYLTYFEMPANGASDPAHNERYYRMDYGPVTLLVLDLCNGNDAIPSEDTSTYLTTASGCKAPDFNPGTPQYVWLEVQLAAAQTNSAFTFVAFHHVPYSSGPHGVASEAQSGVPARVLTPLFLQYGVDAVLAGHDEMYERSTVTDRAVAGRGHARRHPPRLRSGNGRRRVAGAVIRRGERHAGFSGARRRARGMVGLSARERRQTLRAFGSQRPDERTGKLGSRPDSGVRVSAHGRQRHGHRL